MKNKLIISLIVSAMVLFVGIPNALAASANISASKTSCYQGEEVTINVNIVAAAWNLKVNGAINETIVGNMNLDSEGNATTNKSFSLNTSNVGTFTVTLSGDISDYDTDETSDINKSVIITVNEKPAPPEPEVKPTTPSTPSNPSTPSTPSTPVTPSAPSNTNKQTEQTKPVQKEETPVKEPVVEKKEDPIEVKNIDIIGYNLDFNAEKLEYKLTIDKNVKVLYLETASNATANQNGKIDITDKDEIIITFTKGTLTTDYKIILDKVDNTSIRSNIDCPKEAKVDSSKSAGSISILTIIFGATSIVFLITTILLALSKKKEKTPVAINTDLTPVIEEPKVDSIDNNANINTDTNTNTVVDNATSNDMNNKLN